MLSMVIGMASTTKFTITLDDGQFKELKALVAAGRASSVSGFVRKAVEVALNDAAGWSQMLDEAIEASGGPMTDAERTWADTVLGHDRPATKKRKRS